MLTSAHTTVIRLTNFCTTQTVEKEYGVKYDWDNLFKYAKLMNEQNTIELEKWDYFKTPYSALCGIAETLYRLYAWASVNGTDPYFNAVIKQLVKYINSDVQIVECPIVRDEDGLAKSSRNTLLVTHVKPLSELADVVQMIREKKEMRIKVLLKP